DRLRGFENAVRESTIPFLVEVHDWDRLPERFHREIERDYVVMSESPASGTDWGGTGRGDKDRGTLPPRLAATNQDSGRQAAQMTDSPEDMYREAIVAEIAANDRVERALFFNPHATGIGGASPDVNIALLGGQLTVVDQARLSAAMAKIPMAQSVDLVLYDSIQDRMLRESIRREGVEFYACPRTKRSDHATPPVDPFDWPAMPFTEAFLINPVVSIERGRQTPFVEMAAVNSSLRAVHSTKLRMFRGSGSRFQDGDTLMARITPCLENGKIARYYSRSDLDVGHGSTEFIVVRGRPEVTDSQYAYYVTRSELVRSYAIGQMTGTSGRQRVSAESLSHLDVVVPPLTEQRAIAHVLGTLDDKIELNRRMNATLEAMARALFNSWFVDFDPVRAKMEGRDTGLPKEVADLFPDRLVDSELGEIPEGWPLVRLPELIDVNPQRSLRRGEIAPYLAMANMPTSGHAPDSVGQRPFNSGMRFANGDTLVARITPCLENGKTAYVDFLDDDEIGWGSTEYLVFRPRHPLPSVFAYTLARTARFREFAVQNMSGTSGRQRVPATALTGFSIPSPPAAIGAEFGRAARLLLGRARAAGDEHHALAHCRDTLLPKLVSGELRVPDAERLAKTVASRDVAGRLRPTELT
ncbi:MAG: restriction endonuclease subunit S, partial [Gammaproteobacteria bacterium]|nr:restriction endonuclease subunit S [Gammaproteobacteria bacterium]